MSISQEVRTRAVYRPYKSLITVLAIFALMFAAVTTAPRLALADGSLEAQKDGLFHRKGWISPAIYRKKPSEQKTQSQPKSVKQSSGRTSAANKARRQARAAERNRLRVARRAAAKRRIPRKIIQRRERKIAKSGGRRLRKKRQTESVRVASLGVDLLTLPSAKKKRRSSVTGGSARVNWVANSRCVPARLRNAINHVARNYGRVRVNSTCRSRRHNRRVGGASRSWHLLSRAADIRVFGNIGKAARYLRSVVGGYKHYGGGLFHIDTGPRRSW